MKKGNGIAVITVVCMLLVLFSVIGKSDNSTKHTSYSSSSNISSGKNTSSYSFSAKRCAASGCTRSRMSVGIYCSDHTCIKSGCDNKVTSGSSYCYSHKPSATSSSTSSYHYNNNSESTKKYSGSGNTNKYDPYDVYDYDNGDDFADEWAEEFGDGDYDEGYDEAYDYWEDEME